ncbi:MAG: 2Fe-2S iron-sulfur cluster-binding protein [Chlamydiia bacterium]
MSNAKLVVLDRGKEIELGELKEGDSIKGCCEEAGVPFACEEGICGTCIVEVMEGADCLSEYNEAEEDFLGPKPAVCKAGQGVERLACQCKIASSGTVKFRF